MFVLVILISASIQAHPSVIMHDFKTIESCQAAGKLIEKDLPLNEYIGGEMTWKCIPK
ncbi:hypothetical protein [Turneriella parva]|uniref:Uncharacterized protein n=1 Tax=Turneriella parva (strain ATCC BAA-1111 / DSM 21527 / NCTC 11395 / H) TaxID=869212 RepID=I4B9P4_TURPD|nr:hypothetical protein [Turneriella parva]AFM14001.1 hypothetical protein Turpa_3363 [Turneriella parva DSM 21527]